MALELRPVTDEEFPAWNRTTDRAFGSHIDDEAVEGYRAITELDRSLGVFDRGQIVATAGAFTFELTLPGARQIPAAGVTMVSVRASHRRRGLLTRMMEHQLDDVASRGEPVAVLTASEAPIYGRFGYGVATMHAAFSIDTAHGGFDPRVDVPGRLTEVDVDAARKVVPGVHDQARRRTPGDLSRSAARWEHWFLDPPRERHGQSARFFVVHESARGKADGYLAYRVRDDWKDGLPQNKLHVDDFAAVTDGAYASLWRYVLDHDLVGTVTTWGSALDEPVRFMLADSRHLKTKMVSDFLWVRILDVPAALASRTYGTDGGLTIDVVDGFGGRAEGRFTLEAGPKGATCSRARGRRGSADLRMGVDALGSIFLGGIGATELVRAGRIVEERDGAARRADALFRTAPMPFCRTGF